MLIVRPSHPADLPALLDLARTLPVGVTSLRGGEAALAGKLEAAAAAFAEAVVEPGDQSYLFSLTDSVTDRVLGVAGLVGAVGLVEPFYNYRLETLVHASRPLGIHHRVEVLSLCHDLTGHSALNALAILPEWRTAETVALLCRVRLLFAAAHPQRFADQWICELLGVCDDAGQSPVWGSLGRHFFGIDYRLAEDYCATRGRSFIAEMLPQHPIYVSLLTPAAQAALGQRHPLAGLSAGILQQEGFHPGRYLDIFDGGPVIEASRGAIATLRDFRRLTVCVTSRLTQADACLLANDRLEGFRAIKAPAAVDCEQAQVMLAPATAIALGVESGSALLVREGGGDAGAHDQAG